MDADRAEALAGRWVLQPCPHNPESKLSMGDCLRCMVPVARALLQAEEALANASCDRSCAGRYHGADCYQRQAACTALRSLLEPKA